MFYFFYLTFFNFIYRKNINRITFFYTDFKKTIEFHFSRAILLANENVLSKMYPYLGFM